MKVKELMSLLAQKDPEAIVLISGYETVGGVTVAEADMIVDMQTESLAKIDPMTGNRQTVSTEGECSVWIGWKDDYRTNLFLEDALNPGNDKE